MFLSLGDFGNDVVYDFGLLIAAHASGRAGLVEEGNRTILVGQKGVDALLLLHVGGVDLGGGGFNWDVTIFHVSPYVEDETKLWAT